ncbi:hypothetical protein D3C73_1538380 [compost metagenome]
MNDSCLDEGLKLHQQKYIFERLCFVLSRILNGVEFWSDAGGVWEWIEQDDFIEIRRPVEHAIDHCSWIDQPHIHPSKFIRVRSRP